MTVSLFSECAAMRMRSWPGVPGTETLQDSQQKTRQVGPIAYSSQPRSARCGTLPEGALEMRYNMLGVFSYERRN